MTDVQIGSSYYRIGGKSYPMKMGQRCPVCRSNMRVWIENHIIMGHSYAAIEKSLPDDEKFTVAQIGHHRRAGHMPMEEEIRRKLVEKRATEIGFDPEEAVEDIMDHVTLLRTVVHDTNMRVLNREIEPDLKDGMTAAKILAQMDSDESMTQALQDLFKGLRLVMETARAIMDTQQYQDFSSRLMANPNMQALMKPKEEIEA